MSVRRIGGAFVAAMALGLAACSAQDGADEPSVTATAAVAATATATGTAASATTTPVSATPSPTATLPPGVERLASTVWLVEAATGDVLTLAESESETFWDAGFSRDGTAARVRREATVDWYDLAGKPVPTVEPHCRDTSGGAAVGQKVYAGVPCGAVSPDGKWMLYMLDVQPQQTFDGWLLNLASGEKTRVQEAMRHCGGCDGRYGPVWSASGRYVVFAELVQSGNVYLVDVQTLKTTIVGSGADQTQKPAWSPVTDELLLPLNGQAAIVDAATGKRRELQLAWPARWDTTGAYVYSPAWSEQQLTDTTILDSETGSAIATLAGTPSWLGLWTDLVSVAALPGGGYTAVLEHAAGCEGTSIASTLRPEPTCVEGGVGARVSPDGTKVALAVVTDPEAGPFMAPGWSGPSSVVEYEVVLVDVPTGERRVLEGKAYGFGNTSPANEPGKYPPAIEWNKQGTHFIVRWPASYGI